MTGYEKSLESELKHFGENHNRTVIRKFQLADIHRKLTEFDQAKKLLYSAIETDLADEYLSHKATSYCILGLVYRETKEFEKAKESLLTSLEIGIKSLGENHHFVATYHIHLTSIYQDLDKIEKAILHAKKSHEIYLRIFGEEHPKTKNSLSWLGTLQNQNKES